MRSPHLARAGAAAGAAILATMAPAASAVTSTGSPDDGRHPNVGAIVTEAPGGGYAVLCSGTLVAPRVLLTASHCTAAATALPGPEYVTFDEVDVSRATTAVIPATPVTNPRYRRGYRDDVSVMVLSSPVTGIVPAPLPPRGYLDRQRLTPSTRLTVVGYGSQEQTLVRGGFFYPQTSSRWFAVGRFHALSSEWLHMGQVAATGDAGACFGDSGGPTFLGAGAGEGRYVVAVTSTGDVPCYATNVAARTDTRSARDFLVPYLP